MKRYILFIFIFFSFFSCEKEQHYSCDPKIDSWVKDNLSSIDKMDIKNIRKKSLSYQKAIFRACSSAKKAQLWHDKLEEVMQLKWSPEELEHIDLLISSITPDWFNNKTKNNLTTYSKIDSFLNKWINDGQIEFGWSKELCIGMICRLDSLIDKKGNIYSKVTDKNMETKSGSPCGCSQESDWCGRGEDCVSSKCQETVDGCGTLWWHSCDGKCR